MFKGIPYHLVWVSFPYLLMNFIHCKFALFYIAATIGIPLLLIMVRPQLIGLLLLGFWCNMMFRGLCCRVFGLMKVSLVFKRIFLMGSVYCSSRKHLKYSVDVYYNANLGLCMRQQLVGHA